VRVRRWRERHLRTHARTHTRVRPCGRAPFHSNPIRIRSQHVSSRCLRTPSPLSLYMGDDAAVRACRHSDAHHATPLVRGAGHGRETVLMCVRASVSHVCARERADGRVGACSRASVRRWGRLRVGAFKFACVDGDRGVGGCLTRLAEEQATHPRTTARACMILCTCAVLWRRGGGVPHRLAEEVVAGEEDRHGVLRQLHRAQLRLRAHSTRGGTRARARARDGGAGARLVANQPPERGESSAGKV
jgi:hypothetical protein